MHERINSVQENPKLTSWNEVFDSCVYKVVYQIRSKIDDEVWMRTALELQETIWLDLRRRTRV